MAERPNIRMRPLSRILLSTFLPNHQAIKAFEDMSTDVTETLPDAIAASTASADSILAGSAFARQAAPTPLFHSTASDILAGQIFGA